MLRRACTLLRWCIDRAPPPFSLHYDGPTAARGRQVSEVQLYQCFTPLENSCYAHYFGNWRTHADCSPFQRLSVYADDVILFIKPTVADLSFTTMALQMFGEASGLHVNFPKSSAIMIHADETDTERVSHALPWLMDSSPCKYLGLMLSIKQLTRSDWQPVVDDVLNFLPGWQRGMVTRPGRLTLVNTVIRARPTHHLLVADAPKWDLERVDKSCRAFFWAGTEHIHGGKCLVAWQKVCRPKQLGGLGVLDLQKHGLALRLRWEWLRRTDDARPWQGLPLSMDAQVQSAFNSLVHWKVGNGERILFWKDRWIEGWTVAEIAPLVRAKVRTQVVNKRTVSKAWHLHRCANDISGELC